MNLDMTSNGGAPSASNVFGYRIWEQLSETIAPSAKGAFVSPLSLFVAMLMVSNGTKGMTQMELLESLQVQDLSSINQQMAALLQGLCFELANSIWLEPSLQVNDNYAHGLKNYFQASVHPLTSIDIVNQWCSDATHGKIKEIVSSMPDRTALILINAIYFKGSWQHRFRKEDTVRSTFYSSVGVQIPCAMMRLSVSSGTLSYVSHQAFQVVALPYVTTDYRQAMEAIVILPKGDLLSSFIPEAIGQLRQAKPVGGVLELPKFKVESDFELSTNMKHLGIQSLFRPGSDMEPMVTEMPKEGLQVDKVIHKTVVEVNEEGTEAAAVTAVVTGFGCAAPPPEARFYMRCDRPFYFLVCHKETGLIVFLGQIQQPGTEGLFTAAQSMPCLSSTCEVPQSIKSLLGTSRGQLQYSDPNELINKEALPLMNKASRDIVSFNMHTSDVRSTEATLEAAFQVLEFASSRWLKLTGEPSSHAFYNLACVQSLTIELMLLHGTSGSSQSPSGVSSLKGAAHQNASGPMPQICMKIPPVSPVNWLQARLAAAEKCCKTALAAGYTDTAHMSTDRDLKALRELTQA